MGNVLIGVGSLLVIIIAIAIVLLGVLILVNVVMRDLTAARHAASQPGLSLHGPRVSHWYSDWTS